MCAHALFKEDSKTPTVILYMIIFVFLLCASSCLLVEVIALVLRRKFTARLTKTGSFLFLRAPCGPRCYSRRALNKIIAGSEMYAWGYRGGKCIYD